jgi:hypothetical protein
MIASFHQRTERVAALELLLRLAAVAAASVAILGVLPAVAGAAG